ncbi:MAG: hypothetical protein IPM14_16290 [bacterium]|nr:hypothetical protein [bacterium]
MRKKINIFIASLVFATILWGSISLSDVYYTNVDVKLALLNLPEGYTTGTQLPEKIVIRVRGQGWKLLSINVGPETEFRVTLDKDSGNYRLNLEKYLETNRLLFSDIDIIKIYPDTINFFVERILTKKLPIVSGLELDFKPGYGLAMDVLLKPDSVLVSGPVSYLRKMEAIKTESRTFTSLDSKTQTEIGFPKMQGFSFSSNSVEATIDVQRIVDKQFEDIPVEVIDLPDGKEVVLLPNKIGIQVRGGIEILGKLKPGQFNAYVKYLTLVRDTTGSVKPEISLPKNVTLQFTKPDRLRYVIRSY